mmetsp:Transcript_45571/g.120446  ORF Transcript_45571/g.120446 Transcript_45571/m.120446 type:complete len:250 (+) Transcript_45571:77-826(+)
MGWCFDAFMCRLCEAKGLADQGFEHVEGEFKSARTKAGQHTLKELKKALEGSKSRMHEKPDVDVTILEVNFQEGLDVDIFNFSLSGLKCRVRMDVTGSAAQIAAMAAADAAKGAVKKVSALTGGWGESLAQGIGGLRDAAHSSAASGDEVKNVEFDVNLDLGVRKGGEEVSTAVSIVGDALDQVDKVIPVKTAVQYVEKAIGDKVKEIISEWAKDQVKGRTGVDVDAARAKLEEGKAKVQEGLEKAGLR